MADPGAGTADSGDAIALRGLRLLCICGANPEEQERRQPYEFDIELTADIAAVSSDDLDDTIDYGSVLERVAAVTDNEAFRLFERMAERVAQAVLEDARILSVSVEVRKTRPPVPFELTSAGIRISRRR